MDFIMLYTLYNKEIQKKNALKCNETVENSIHKGGCNRFVDNKVPFDARKFLTTCEDFSG